MADYKRVALDTTILLALFNKNGKIMKKMWEIYNRKTEIFIPTIALYEYWRGSLFTSKSLNGDKLTKRRIDLMIIIKKFKLREAPPFDKDCAELCGDIYTRMMYKGIKNLKERELDLLIGGISISLDCPLFTINEKDFKDIPGIQLVKI